MKNIFFNSSLYKGTFVLIVKYFIFLLPHSNPLNAQDAKIFDAENTYHLTRFGTSVSIYGNRILIGNTQYNSQGQGMAYLYLYDEKQKTWKLETKLSVDGEAKEFGSAVALSENYALIGAPVDNNQGRNTGAAYLFAYSETMGEWYLEDQLVAANPKDFSTFGRSVSISGTKAIIGAPNEDKGIGAAYIFARDEFTGKWRQEARLKGEGGHWGTSVFILGNRAIVGAPGYTGGYNQMLPGATFIYNFYPNKEDWQQDTILTVPEAARYSGFGESVALDGNRAIIGAPNSEEIDDYHFNSGSAYIFAFDNTRNTWYPEVKLFAEDATRKAQFGYTVAISNGVVLVGAPGGDGSVKLSGKAYLFYLNHDDRWYRGNEIIDNNLSRFYRFGSLASLSEERAVLSASKGDTVYVYELSSILSLKVQQEEPLPQMVQRKTIDASQKKVTLVQPSTQTAAKVCDETLFIADEMPKFEGGDKALRESVRIEYPKELIGTGKQGKVYVTMVVGSDGQVMDVRIARGVDKILDQLALERVRRLRFLTGGRHNGKPVCVHYNLPVAFVE